MRLARNHDLSARLDADEQVPIELLEPRRKKKQKKAKPGNQDKGPQRAPEIIRTPRQVRTRGLAGASDAESIKAQAAAAGRSVHDVLAERMKPSTASQATGRSATSKPVISSGQKRRAPPPRPQTPAAAAAARPAPKESSKAMAKQMRTIDEAKRRNVTVEALMAERRREAAEQRSLRAEADRRGITVKALRSLGMNDA